MGKEVEFGAMGAAGALQTFICKSAFRLSPICEFRSSSPSAALIDGLHDKLDGHSVHGQAVLGSPEGCPLESAATLQHFYSQNLLLSDFH